jgi:hypothetical protein
MTTDIKIEYQSSTKFKDFSPKIIISDSKQIYGKFSGDVVVNNANIAKIQKSIIESKSKAYKAFEIHMFETIILFHDGKNWQAAHAKNLNINDKIAFVGYTGTEVKEYKYSNILDPFIAQNKTVFSNTNYSYLLRINNESLTCIPYNNKAPDAIVFCVSEIYDRKSSELLSRVHHNFTELEYLFNNI